MRIKYKTDKLISNFQEFEDIVVANTKENNGYVKPTKDFPFIGGRIAQRAYFDTIRDIAQFDKRNSHLSPIIRLSKFEFEEKYKQPFSKIRLEDIEEYLKIRFQESETLPVSADNLNNDFRCLN